ncbi:MAG: hypothetical protein IJX16_02425 [Clostridia bacterium]|nr:hypothetical protein [Clostridia bacterium]
MVDIHSHLLPFVDDGSDGYEMSIELLKNACNQGVTDVVLTPHYRHEFVEDEQSILENFEKFKQIVNESGLKVNLYIGREVFIYNDYKEAISGVKPNCLNGTKYILVEFDFDTVVDIVNIVYELARKGYIPIVAHLERYEYANLNTAVEIKQSGGLIQVNAQSLVNPERRSQKKFLTTLLDENLVDFVASDIHANRKYLMKKAFNKVLKKYGRDTASAVFYQNAQNIIKGQS